MKACFFLLSFCLCWFTVAPVYSQHILIPDSATVEENFAASELAEHLQLVLGKKIAIYPESHSPALAEQPILYVGGTLFAEQQGVAPKIFGKEEWHVKSFGRNVFLCGGAPRGTLYACYEFLERACGILWLDEYTTHAPLLENWPVGLDLRGKPSFEIRGLYAYFRDPQQKRRLYMVRNRQNLFHDEGNPKELNELIIDPVFGSPRGCHTYYDYTKDWAENLENCFSLSEDGKRLRAVNASGPGQICFSNPLCAELFAKKLKDFIEQDRKNSLPNRYPRVYEISANDNESKCVCDQCLKAAASYGSYGGVVLAFTNAVAARIAPEYPDILIEMFAYGFAEIPPSGIEAEANVLIRVAQLGSEFGQGIRDTLRPLSHFNNSESKRRIEGWSKLGKLAIWDYWTLYCKDVRLTTLSQTSSENLAYYANLGVKSVFVEVEGPMTNVFYALRLWLGFRLMNNAQLDGKQEVARFMKAYYQDAYQEMQALHDLIEQRSELVKQRLNDVPISRRADLDDSFFAEAEKLLSIALSKVTAPEYRKRIAKERALIDYIQLLRRENLAPLDLDELEKRVSSDLRLVLPDWLSIWQVDTFLQDFAGTVAGFKLKIPLPEAFAGKNVVFDLCWPKLYGHYRSKLLDVPDAAGGRAVVLKGGEKDKGVLSFGFYDVAGKNQVKTIEIEPGKAPLDEKFHLYDLGKVLLTSHCYVWTHSSWEIQRTLQEFYESNGMSNEYRIFLSLKVQGPAYVPGSKQENAVMLDRILLIRD